MTTLVYSARSAKTSLEPAQWTLTALGTHDVEVQITHCGLCHTDKHMLDNDWGISRYPLVAGHEGVGIVKAVGDAVELIKPGDRVGIGWIRDSCGNCRQCSEGQDNLCKPGYTPTMLGSVGDKPNSGCFAHVARINEKFAFKIPEGMSSENAAPLLCAGVTVYTPLRNWVKRPAMKVGVVGVGGLGHLAIKMAHAMGCNVTAFSSTKDKEEEAFQFGSTRFVHLNDTGAMAKQVGTQELLIITSSATMDWGQLFGLLENAGTMVLVGIPPTEIKIPVIPLVFSQKNICGSIVGGSRYMNEMLEFCAINKIAPMVEVMPFSEINSAIKKVVDNKARYRIVLKH